MRMAIQAARAGMAEGQSPFAACIVRDGTLICCMHNHVWQNQDITAHAEIMAIREACRELNNVHLAECVLYSTCEPCPMCFTAIHWARISKIYFGARIEDAKLAGFNELIVPNQVMKSLGGSPVEIVGGLLRQEVLQLFQEWSSHPNRRTY